MAPLALTALASGAFAAVIAIAVTRAIERFGGLIGGVLGTMPTTIIPTAVGLAGSLRSPAELTESLFTVAVGMLVNAAFLSTWRFLPQRLPVGWSLGRRLAVMVLTSYCVWMVLAAIAVSFELNVLKNSGTASIVAFCVLCYFALIGLGIALCIRPLDAAPAKNAVPWPQLLARGCLAGLAIFVTVMLSSLNGVVAGMASTFPAIFSTTMISLWIAQGEACPVGATGPMVLGSASVPTFAFIYAGLFTGTTLGYDSASGSGSADGSGANDGGPYLTALLSWILAVSMTSVPITVFLRWRRSVSTGAGAAAGAGAGGGQGSAGSDASGKAQGDGTALGIEALPAVDDQSIEVPVVHVSWAEDGTAADAQQAGQGGYRQQDKAHGRDFRPMTSWAAL